MKLYCVFMLCFLVFFSCEMEKEIDYNTTGKTNFIVVNGFISSEYGVNVLISTTVPPNDHTLSDVIENPEVWLYVNELPFSKLNQVDQYRFSLPADSLIGFNEETAFSIIANAEGYSSVKSEIQKFVEKVEIDTAYIKNDPVSGHEYIYWEYSDDLYKDNFYSFDINYFNNGISHGDLRKFIPMYAHDDKGFNGHIIQKIRLGEECDSIQIKLYSVSESLANFIDSYFDYSGSYQDLSYETVYTVESQIDNGFGFFASYEWSEYIFK